MSRESTPPVETIALLHLQARYADLVNRRAWAELPELFRPDATVSLDTVTTPPRLLNGPAELGEFVGGAIARYDHFGFAILANVADLTGDDSATGRVWMCEHRHDAEIGEWTTAYGLYEDDYVRTDGRWWFAARRYRSLARNGPDAGVFGLPPDR